jgi:hypothetical protein
MRARAVRRAVVAVGAVAFLAMGSGVSEARGSYAGATTWALRVTATTCVRTYQNWSGRLPTGNREVNVTNVRGTFNNCYTKPEIGTLRGTDAAGTKHVWYCSARAVKRSLADEVFRLTCHEQNIAATYNIDLRGGGIGDVTAPSGSAGLTGYATYAMTG